MLKPFFKVWYLFSFEFLLQFFAPLLGAVGHPDVEWCLSSIRKVLLVPCCESPLTRVAGPHFSPVFILTVQKGRSKLGICVDMKTDPAQTPILYKAYIVLLLISLNFRCYCTVLFLSPLDKP